MSYDISSKCYRSFAPPSSMRPTRRLRFCVAPPPTIRREFGHTQRPTSELIVRRDAVGRHVVAVHIEVARFEFVGPAVRALSACNAARDRPRAGRHPHVIVLRGPDATLRKRGPTQVGLEIGNKRCFLSI